MISCKNLPLENFERRDSDEICQPMSRWASSPDLPRSSYPEFLIQDHFGCLPYTPPLRDDPRRGFFLPLENDKRKSTIRRRLQDQLIKRMPALPDLSGPGYFSIDPEPALMWDDFEMQGGPCTNDPAFCQRNNCFEDMVALDLDLIQLKRLKLFYGLPNEELPYVLVPGCYETFSKRAMLQLRADGFLTPHLWSMIQDLCHVKLCETETQAKTMAADIITRHLEFLTPEHLDERVLSLIYESAGLVMDYGFLMVRRIIGGANFQVQEEVDDDDTEGLFTDAGETPQRGWLATCAYKIYDWVRPKKQNATPTTAQAFCQKIYESIASTFSFLGMASKTVAVKVKDFVMLMFRTILGPITSSMRNTIYTVKMIVVMLLAGLVTWLYCTASSSYLMTCAIRSGVSIVQSGADVARVAADSYIEKTVEDRDHKLRFESQGAQSFSLVSSLLILASTALGLNYDDEQYLNHRLTTILKIVAAGTIAASLGAQLLLLLPVAMREGIVRKFGSPEETFQLEANSYLVEARTLLALSKNVDVILSKAYSSRIQPLVNKSAYLLKKAKAGPLANLILATSSQLMRLRQILSTYDHAKPIRKTPYGMHIYSSPGVGKSLAVARIMSDVFGIKKPWALAKGDEFWTGYGRQEGIIWDEFMVGEVLERQANAKVWLSVMSATDYRPPMASLEDPSVGIKGTPITNCKAVITCNNVPIVEAPGYDMDALNRRHNKKVLLTIKPEWAKNWDKKGCRFSFDGMTKEQLVNLDWLNFQIYDYSEKQVAQPMDYTTFKGVLRASVNSFREVTDLLCEAIYKDQFSEEDSEKEIERTLAEFIGVPSDKYSLFEIVQEAITSSVGVFTSKFTSLKNWMSGSFETQGGDNKKSKRKGKKPKSKNPDSAQSSTSSDSEETMVYDPINTPVITQVFTRDPYKLPEAERESFNRNSEKLDAIVAALSTGSRTGARPKTPKEQVNAEAAQQVHEVLCANSDKLKSHHEIVITKSTTDVLTASNDNARVDSTVEYTVEASTDPIREILGARRVGENYFKMNGVDYYGEIVDVKHPLAKRRDSPPSLIPWFRIETEIIDGKQTERRIPVNPDGTDIPHVTIEECETLPSRRASAVPSVSVSAVSEYASIPATPNPARQYDDAENFQIDDVFRILNELDERSYSDAQYADALEEFCNSYGIREGDRVRFVAHLNASVDDTGSAVYLYNHCHHQHEEVGHDYVGMQTIELPLTTTAPHGMTMLKEQDYEVIMTVDEAPWKTCIPLRMYFNNLLVSKTLGEDRVHYYFTTCSKDGFFSKVPAVVVADIIDVVQPEMAPAEVKLERYFLGMTMRKFVLTVCSLFLIIFCIYKFVTRDGNTKTEEKEDEQCFVAQSPPDEPQKGSPKHYKATIPQKAKYITNISNGMDLARIKNPNGALWALPLSKGYLLCPYHFSLNKKGEYWPDSTSIEIMFKGEKSDFQFMIDNLTIFKDQDLAILEIPAGQAKNVTQKMKTIKLKSKFLSEEEIQSFQSLKVQIENDGRLFISRGVFATGLSSHKGDVRVGTQSGLLYDFPGKPGDCGLPVIVSSGPHAGKIASIHSACSTAEARSFGPVIAREMIEAALKDVTDLEEAQIPQDFVVNVGEATHDDEEAQKVIVELKSCPGVKNVRWAEKLCRVPRKTALRPSAISHHLPWSPRKTQPLMSKFDRRVPLDIDPGYKALINAGSFKPAEWDMELLEGITSDLKERYSTIEAPMPDRLLTFEETIKGVEGALKSMDPKTSSGFPWILHQSKVGKRGFFYYEQDVLFINSHCQSLFNEVEASLLAGEPQDTRYLAYIKDEPVKPGKVEEGKCRLIFSFSTIHNMVMRKYFGYALARFLHGCEDFPPTLGINPSSFDMDRLHRYLTELGPCDFVAGDYKNFDRSTSREVINAALDIICHMTCSDCPEEMKKAVKSLVMDSPVQYEKIVVGFNGYHPSGCLFTTIINCLVNEIYFRYLFTKRYPDKNFDSFCRLKVHGDDHVLAVKRNTNGVRLTPVIIGEELSKLNLLYTMDVKDQELTDEYRAFDNITYLGCEPKLIFGKWCGVLKQDILEETVHWTRNGNLSLEDEIKSSVILSSVRGREYFRNYKKALLDAADMAGLSLNLQNVTWHQSMRDVGNRTTGNNYGLMPVDWFTSELHEEPLSIVIGPFESQVGDEISPSVLTKFDETRAVKESNSKILSWKADSIQEIPFHMLTGTDSYVVREAVTWSTSNNLGDTLASWSWPHQVLSLGDQDNLQNMPFQKNQFFEGSCEIMVQTTGGPFLQGLLVLFHVYGNNLPAGNPFAYSNLLSAPHVLIDASRASTSTLEASFRYFCNVLQTDGVSEVGKFYLVVYSPLRTADDSNQLNLTMFSKFPNASFTIPRMVPTSLRGPRVLSFDVLTSSAVAPSTNNFEMQGFGDFLTGIFSPIVTIGKGIMNIANGVVQTVSGAGSLLGFLGFDNPPISAHMPVGITLPSMSNLIGPRHIRTLGASNQELASKRAVRATTEESEIGWLGNRMCLLTTLTWKVGQTESDQLLYIDLNSFFGRVEGDTDVPMNVALLNQFWFWRGDLKLTFMAVKSRFHVGRLNCSVAYATNSYNSGQVTTNYNQILDFTEGNDMAEVVIPYNAKTSFLSTSKGVNDNSLGVLKISVRQSLMAPTSVFPSVSILVFIQFQGLKVAVPRPVSDFSIVGIDAGPTLFETQGGEEVEDRTVDTGETAHIEATASTSDYTEPPTRLELGELFEYPIRSLSELMRRYVPVVLDNFGLSTSVGSPIFSGHCAPQHWARGLFTYWTGGFCWRILSDTKQNEPAAVNYTPWPGKLSGSQLMAQGFSASGSNFGWYSSVMSGNIENLSFATGMSSWIDVRTPMYSVYNYLYTEANLTKVYQPFNSAGTLSCNFKPQAAFYAGADDFRYHCYRPPAFCQINPTSDTDILIEGVRASLA